MREKKVRIPDEIYKAIEKKIKDTQFSSVQGYIVHLLKENLRISDTTDMDDEEEERIKERLRSLGYLE